MTVRIGIIGAGRMATIHAECLETIEGVRVAAVAENSQTRAAQMASRFGLEGYADWREMMDKAALDAVYICTPNTAHLEPALAACERGLSFLIEKPLAFTMAEAYRIANAADRAGIMTCVGYHWRYTEAARRAREILAGKPLALAAGEWLWTRPPVAWLRDRALGGGQVVDQTTHLTDMCCWLAGPVTELYAAYTLNTHSRDEFDNWDGYSVAWHHRDGAVGNLRCTYALFPGIIDVRAPHVDFSARDLFLSLSPAGLLAATPEGTQQWPNEEPFHAPMNRAFANALRTGDRSHICSSVGDTLESLAFTLAANASAESGRTVDLPTFMARPPG